MKRGTRTWILYYMVVIHGFAVIGSTGIVMYSSLYFPGFWNWLLLIIMSFFNHSIFESMFKIINRIIKRKERMY
jgi:hypothetical protein